MTSTMPRKAFLALLSAGALALTACGSDDGGSAAEANEDGTKTVRVTTIPSVSSLPLRIAIDKGYFEEEGLDVELTEGMEVAAWQSAAGKQFDIVFTTPGVYLSSVVKGLDNTLVSNSGTATEDFASISLVAPQEMGWGDLKGKKVATLQLTGGSVEAVKYLAGKEGVKPEEIQFVQMGTSSHVDNLKSGNIDAAMTASPVYLVAEKAGMWVQGDDLGVTALKDITGGELTQASTTLYAASSEWAESNGETIDAWKAAVQKAMDDIESDPESAKGVLESWLNMPPELAEITPFPTYTTDVDEAEIRATWDLYAANGTLSGDYPEDRVKIRSS